MALRARAAVAAGMAGVVGMVGAAALAGAGSVPGPGTLLGRGGPMAGWDGRGGVQEAGGDTAGGQVVRVEVSADARAVGAALVSMRYQLQVEPEASAVPFTLLLFAPTTVTEVSARVGGEALAVRVPDAGGPRMEGEIELPAAVAASGRISLDVGYRVTDAVREEGAGVRVALPMLAVDWTPAEAIPGMFQAEVALPEAMEAREIFPVTPGGGVVPEVARASLQVLPAVVRVRALPVGSVGLSLPGVLELLVLIAVVACGMIGLRFVRRAR